MSEDLISRQAAIEAMGCVSDSICAQQAIDALADLPSAERRGMLVKEEYEVKTETKDCGDCFIAQNTNLEDDDSPCLNCGVDDAP